uniref:Large ribosomal subunit protein mL64 n=1 Tax=Romanomermis culicivorax TaxID=13658 RepID=A0A915IE18_ROMCU
MLRRTRSKILISPKSRSEIFYSTAVKSAEKIETSSIDNDFDYDNENAVQSLKNVQLKKYENLKDLSKLRSWHRAQIRDEMTPPDFFKWQKERWALKERYAKYGEASGVEPGVLWMNAQELAEKRTLDAQFNPNLVDTIKEFMAKNEAVEKSKLEKIKLVDENLKIYPKLMKEFLKKKEDKYLEIEKAQELRAKKLKEVRDSFGYKIDESDPRFKVKLMMKQEEEKAVTRIAKKKEKQAKMLERLQAMTASLAAQMPDATDRSEGNSQ